MFRANTSTGSMNPLYAPRKCEENGTKATKKKKIAFMFVK